MKKHDVQASSMFKRKSRFKTFFAAYSESEKGSVWIKKNDIILFGTIAILFIAIFLLFNNSNFIVRDIAEVSPSISPEIQAENEKKQKEVEEVSTFIEQVNYKLKNKGYAFQTLVTVYSKDDVWVKYIIDNKDATKSVQEDILSVFFESVENKNLDSNSFNVKVSDRNDGPDW